MLTARRKERGRCSANLIKTELHLYCSYEAIQVLFIKICPIVDIISLNICTSLIQILAAKMDLNMIVST